MDVRQVALTAVFIAVVFVFTVIVAISIPATHGFWNVGETGVYLAALVGGPIVGAIAGGIGSALADLVLGYAIYAPGTLVIKASEGFITGFLYDVLYRGRRKNIVYWVLLAVIAVICSLVTVFYYFGSSAGGITIELSSELLHSGISFTIHYTILIAIVIIIGALSCLLVVLRRETPIMVFSCLAGGVIMVTGYFLYETLIFGSKIALVEVIPNFMQVLIGIILAVPVVKKLRELGVLVEDKGAVGKV